MRDSAKKRRGGLLWMLGAGLALWMAVAPSCVPSERCSPACKEGYRCWGTRCLCQSPRRECGGVCADLTINSSHCGQCDNKCAQGSVCEQSRCKELPEDCASGLQECGGQCVDTGKDPLHCGGCDLKCNAGALCASGKCQCPTGTTRCGDTCVDTQKDPKHCGGCDVACKSGEACTAGACKGSGEPPPEPGTKPEPAPDASSEPASDAPSEPAVDGGEQGPADALVEARPEFGPEGQPSPAVWAQPAGGKDPDWGHSIASDPRGNVYVAGRFQGQADFGNIALTSKGNWDIFVAKLDTNGNWLWAKSAGGKGLDAALSIAVDGKGDAYLTGEFADQADFGSIQLKAIAGADAFVAKINAAGTWTWATAAGSKSIDTGQAITLGGQGEVYVAGTFQETLQLGALNLVSKGGADIFVARLDALGKWVWAKAAGSTGTDTGWGLQWSAAGLVLVGSFSDGLSYGTSSLKSKGKEDILVAMLDDKGTWKWAQGAGGTSDSERAHALAIGPKGEILVTGRFSGVASFGTSSLQAKGTADAFIARLDAAGKWLWAAQAGGANVETTGADVAVSGSDVWLVGAFQGQPSFGIHSLSALGSDDIFMAKLDLSGKWLLARSAGSKAKDRVYGLAIDGGGRLLLTGEFSADIGLGSGTRFTPKGASDIFVWKTNP